MEQILLGRVPLSIQSLLETLRIGILDFLSPEATLEDYLEIIKLFDNYGIFYSTDVLINKMFYDDRAPFYIDELSSIPDKSLAKFVSYLFEVSENKTALSDDLHHMFQSSEENEMEETFTVFFLNIDAKFIARLIMYYNENFWNLDELLSQFSFERLNELLYEVLEGLNDEPNEEDLKLIDKLLDFGADPLIPIRGDKSIIDLIENYEFEINGRIIDLHRYLFERRSVRNKAVEI